MSFLDEAVYNVEKGAMPPNPEDLKDDDIVNIGEDDIDEGVLSYFKQGFSDLKTALKGGLGNDEIVNIVQAMLKLDADQIKTLDIPEGSFADDKQKEQFIKTYISQMRKEKVKMFKGDSDKRTVALKKKIKLDEGKLSRFLGGLALSAAALGAIGSINQSDKVLQGLQAKYEQADTKEEKKKIKDQISKRILFLDTGKSDSTTPMNEETITGEYEGKPVKFKIKDITNLKDILDISKSAKDFVNKISMAVTDETSSLSREDAKKLILFYKKRTMKEAEDIKLPSDTTFTLDLKHLVKKHMNKGNDKESAVKFTKALMKKLHSKGEVEVDGTKVMFKEMKMDQDIPLALPEPDAPDFLGDDGMDYEGGMAKSQMLKMKKYVDALSNMIEDESQLESWVQAKLTKASDYMSAVYHYLDYQKSRMNELNEDEGQNIADFLNANYKEIASKLGNPGSNFEIIGDNKVATAGDGNKGIDISFDRNHMDKLFPEDDPYNEVKELTIAGKVVYYNDYRGN